ncbi:hypothetical protein [Alkalicoccobacillus gibsonii]|uniref:hypothetical protein n=1 Tax=Alkalicoccobacillus gibsonii TaxID=79881 RepID=UPI00351918CF
MNIKTFLFYRSRLFFFLLLIIKKKMLQTRVVKIKGEIKKAIINNEEPCPDIVFGTSPYLANSSV